jgi:hypothetical protein
VTLYQQRTTNRSKTMGNRAVVTFNNESSKCIYLHWNGGRDSVRGFLKAAKELGIAPRAEEFGQMIAQYFFEVPLSSINVYLEDFEAADKDNFDNGVYFVSDDFKITGRNFLRGEEQDTHNSDEIAAEIVALARKAQEVAA